MKSDKLILVSELIIHYKIEADFFNQIESIGLLEIHLIEQQKFLPQKQLKRFEKILNLHRDLEINLEGIDVILQLQKRINTLEKELAQTKSRLHLYQ